MHALRTYDYAVVRVVPRVERGEFVNAGIILSCDVERILLANIELDEKALLAIDAHVDLGLVRSVLQTIPAICAGGEGAGEIGKLSARERFHWLVAPKHDRANLAGAHGPVRRTGRGTGSSDADDGQARDGPLVTARMQRRCGIGGIAGHMARLPISCPEIPYSAHSRTRHRRTHRTSPAR